MFRPEHVHPKQKLQITFNDGGLGDNIARMTAIKYLRDIYPFLDIHLFCPDFFVSLAENLVSGITVHKFSKMSIEWDLKINSRQTRNAAHDGFATHLVDNAFNVLVNKQVGIEHKNYCILDTSKIDISGFNLPEKYAVVTTGYTAKVREMIPETVNGISKYLVSKGVTPVFLGSRQSDIGLGKGKLIGNFKNDIDYSVGVDLIDKTNLLDAAKIIGGARAIVGLDNGLLHLAATTDTPIVMGFTSVKPEHRVPYRNNILGHNVYSVTPPKSLACRFCQSNWDFQKGHDYKDCYYKDYACTNMEAQKYIYFLDKIL